MTDDRSEAEEKMKKPVKPNSLCEADAPAQTISRAVEKLVDRADAERADLLLDDDFLEGVLKQLLEDSPFPRLDGEGFGDWEKKNHLEGRTKKVKTIIFLSESEMEQVRAIARARGSRSHYDLINELVVRVLAAARMI
jgi:hypothetical protein